MTVGENLAFPLAEPRPAARRDRGARSARSPGCSTSAPFSTARRNAADRPTPSRRSRSAAAWCAPTWRAILFDEPLTVIDPALKWELRSKLEAAASRASTSRMIYVTHDQTEALTFADTVVVMHEGSVVQTGTPEELFVRPAHTFVGYFIGSPGMNVLPAEVQGRQARIAGHTLALDASYGALPAGARIEIGIRPEFVSVAAPAPGCCRPRSSASTISAAAASRAPALGDLEMAARDARRRSAIAGEHGGPGVRPGADPRLCRFCVASRGRRDGKDRQPEGLVPRPAGVRAGRLLGGHPADDGGQLFGAGHVRQQQVLLERHRLVPGAARSSTELGGRFFALAVAQPRSSPRSSWRSRYRSASSSRWRCRARAGASPSRLVAAGAAAADPVERRRHDLADLRPQRHRPAGLHAQLRWASTTTTSPNPIDAWLTIIVMDVWHWTSLVALLCYAGLKSIPEAFYQAATHRRRVALGGVRDDPAAEDEARPADRRACCASWIRS